jgi:activating signal cointegrator 1
MKGLTIHQPWASLLVKKKKQFETRDWQRNYRGLLAIHAGKEPLSPLEDYYDILYALKGDFNFDETYFNSTFGKIIAIATLKDIHLMTKELIKKQSHLERVSGYWEPGRYAWEFTDIKPLPKPIPVRGLPGLWDVSDEIQQQISQQLKLN